MQMDNIIQYPVTQDYNGQDIITFGDYNPTLRSPGGDAELSFYSIKSSLNDPERYKRFLKNIESQFRSCKEYKIYKGCLMNMGFDHCMVMGNIEAGDGKDDKVDIELHHNIINLFDVCILICEHILNTIGQVCTFDVLQLLIFEHFDHRVPVCFLSTTMHEMYTNDPNAYIPPDMTIGRWWELIDKYRYGITFEIAQKVLRYITKYQNQIPVSISPMQQEQILNFAYYNTFGINQSNQKRLSMKGVA